MIAGCDCSFAGRAARRSAIPADALNPLEHECRHAVLAGLASVPRVPGPKNSTKQRPGRELPGFCRDRQGDVLRFTTDTSIWPTNNISERGVRPLKTQQKVSGRLASDEVTQDRLGIRSYIDTARKHGRNAMDVLHQLMLGNPWRPPAAAFFPQPPTGNCATWRHECRGSEPVRILCSRCRFSAAAGRCPRWPQGAQGQRRLPVLTTCRAVPLGKYNHLWVVAAGIRPAPRYL